MYEDYLEGSLQNLKSIIADSGTRPILFVGTGLSIRYIDSPSWEGLLDVLIERNTKCTYPVAYYIQNHTDNTSIASQLVDEYNDYAWENFKAGLYPENLYSVNTDKSAFLKYEIAKYFSNLMGSFDIEKHPLKDEIISLSKLQPQAIVTTNYDKVLETIFDEYSVTIGQQVIKSKDTLKIGQILKIHGCMDSPKDIVISSEDYEEFNNKQRYLIAKLLTYFMEHPIIFLGYSISDPNIKSILSDVAEIVCDSPDKVVENIWFIEWSKDEIPQDFRPPTDKNIDLGNGKGMRINYILLKDFTRLYESLNKSDVSSVNALRNLEDKIYNIIKSKSISELKVDYLALEKIENEEKLAEMIGVQNVGLNGKAVSVVGLGTLSDPEQIKTRYPFRISDVAEMLGYSYWYNANKLLNIVKDETGVNIKNTGNRYHIDMSTINTQPLHRYSIDAVKLLERVRDAKEYYVYNDKNTIVRPKKETLNNVLG